MTEYMQVGLVAIISYGFFDHILQLAALFLIFFNFLQKKRNIDLQIEVRKHTVEADEEPKKHNLLVARTSLIIITNIVKNNLPP